jgi:hypothetical protein
MAAANDLTTLAYVQAYMQDSSAGTAAALPALITAISTYFQTQSSQPFLNATYNLRFNGSGNHRLILWPQPVNVVNSVMIFGNAAQPATDTTSSGYVADKYGLWMRGSTFPKGIANVLVNWNSGYGADAGSMPADVQQAIADVCNVKLKMMPNADKSSIALMQQTTTFRPSDMTPFASSVLKAYSPKLITHGMP